MKVGSVWNHVDSVDAFPCLSLYGPWFEYHLRSKRCMWVGLSVHNSDCMGFPLIKLSGVFASTSKPNVLSLFSLHGVLD